MGGVICNTAIDPLHLFEHDEGRRRFTVVDDTGGQRMG